MAESIDGARSRPRFLKVQEVATLLRVSRMSVYRLVHSGEIEAVRFGRTIRIPERAVTNYLRDSFFQAG
jgi:excisionase family DNA binding protein